MRFLVVDDSSTMRRIIINTLNKLGYTDCQEAGNGREGLDAMTASPVDVVITDWNMPDIDGLTFFKRLKQDPDHKDIPVIMVTGNADIEHVKTAMAAGLRFFLRKPVKPADLKLRVEAAVGKLA